MVSGLLVWSRWVTLHSSWGSFAFHPNKRYARVVPGGIPVRRKGNSKSWTGCDILPTSRISKAVNWLIYYFLPIYSDNLAVECSSSRIAPLPCNSLRVIMCWWQLWVLDIKASVDRFSLIRICHLFGCHSLPWSGIDASGNPREVYWLQEHEHDFLPLQAILSSSSTIVSTVTRWTMMLHLQISNPPPYRLKYFIGCLSDGSFLVFVRWIPFQRTDRS